LRGEPLELGAREANVLIARLTSGASVRSQHPNLEGQLLWVRTFDTIEELQAALVDFATRYNETWLVARHGYRTPVQARADQCLLDPNSTANLKLAA
jgi:hypothetical protein